MMMLSIQFPCLAVRSCLVVGLYLSLCGCGGDGDGDGDSGSNESAFESGLEASREVDTLNAAEARALCEGLATELARVVTPERIEVSLCEATGAFLSTSPKQCEQIKQECIAQSADAADSTVGIDGTESDCATAPADLANCEATVGELETCFNDTIAELDQLLDAYQCDQAASLDPAQAPDLDAVTSATSCDALAPTCDFVDTAEAAAFGSLR